MNRETSHARRRRRWPLILLSVLVAVSVAAFAAACGGDDDEGGEEASATDVTVTADEYSFDLSATPTADTREITLENVGKQEHVLIFARINKGFTLDEAFKLEGRKGSAEEVTRATPVNPGQTKKVKVKGPLEAGNYAMVCPVPAGGGKTHYDLGQVQEFEIQ